MTTATAKWTEERTQQLVDIVGPSGTEVSREAIDHAAEVLGVSTRSITSKLSKIEGHEYTIEKAEAKKAFSDEDGAALRALVEENPHTYTYAELAAAFKGGQYSAKAVQGKVLALKLTDLVNKTEKVATPKTYSAEEEATLVNLANNGGSLEDAAQAVGKSVQSVRGKFLSLLKEGRVSNIPTQANKAAPKADVFEGLDIANLTVDEIVEALKAKGIEKTARGIKQTLTLRQLSAKDYAPKAKKSAE